MNEGLVERARAGDRDAFNLLAANAVDRLYALARLILRDTDRAEDAVQEALIRCWRDLPSLRDTSRFEAWLHRLLMHAIADEFRARRRFAANVTLLDHAAASPDRSESLAVREQIERAFGRLSVEHRTVLVLRHYAGMSIDEAGAVLGVPAGTVKSRLHYATEAIRAAIEADDRSTAMEAS